MARFVEPDARRSFIAFGRFNVSHKLAQTPVGGIQIGFQQFAGKAVAARRARHARAENMRFDMRVMPAYHVRRQSQTTGGRLVGMGGEPRLSQLRVRLARPSIAQSFARFAVISGARLQLRFEGRRRHQIGRGCTCLFSLFQRQPTRLDTVFARQCLSRRSQHNRFSRLYFFAARAAARPLPQPAFARLPITVLNSQRHQALQRPFGFAVQRQCALGQCFGLRRVMHARQIKQPLKAQLRQRRVLRVMRHGAIFILGSARIA